MLLGDQVRLKQVLINLTKNALKFTVRGKITIQAAFDYESEMLRVSVTDTGKGISTQEIKQLFKKYGSVLQSANKNREGIGMGLTICKHIVEKSGGTIESISLGENQGTTFVFSMNMQIAGKIDDQIEREDEEQESME